MHEGHEHEHTHEHVHEHTHEHTHEHSHGEQSRNTALLAYMLEHNRSHAAELSALADTLAADGKNDAAQAIKAAVEYFNSGNDKLAEALAAVK